MSKVPRWLGSSTISDATTRSITKPSIAVAREHGSGGRPGWVRTYVRILLVADALSAAIAGAITLAVIGSDTA